MGDEVMGMVGGDDGTTRNCTGIWILRRGVLGSEIG